MERYPLKSDMRAGYTDHRGEIMRSLLELTEK